MWVKFFNSDRGCPSSLTCPVYLCDLECCLLCYNRYCLASDRSGRTSFNHFLVQFSSARRKMKSIGKLFSRKPSGDSLPRSTSKSNPGSHSSSSGDLKRKGSMWNRISPKSVSSFFSRSAHKSEDVGDRTRNNTPVNSIDQVVY